MLKFYFSSLVVFVFSSCGVSVNYLGTSFNETDHVDVYVDLAAIKKGYAVIGKGYEKIGIHTRNGIEKLQMKAIQKAKQKGADAVLFQDYHVLQTGTAISTSKIDTVNKAFVSATLPVRRLYHRVEIFCF